MKKISIEKIISQNQFSELEIIIEKLSNIDAEIFDGKSLLIYAIEQDNLEVIQFLITHSSDVFHENHNGYNSFEYACICNSINSVIYLLKKYPAFSLSKGLIYGATLGNIEVEKYLLESKFDYNITDSTGRTALHWIAQEGYYELLILFLSYEVDLNILDCEGQTPLCIAVGENHEKVVKILLEKGADPNLCFDESPLMLAVAYRHSRLVELLLKYGSNVNFQNNQGETALQLSIQYGYTELEKQLLAFGADKSLIDKENNV